MAALEYDLLVNQGETWSATFPVLDGAGDSLSVDGWTAKAQVRQYASSESPLFEWSTDIGNATVAGTSVTLNLVPADTSGPVWPLALYDIELTDTDGNVTRLAEGKFRVKPEITR